jgi:hypothetical protein
MKYKGFIIIIICIIISIVNGVLVFADIGPSLHTPDLGTTQQKA